MSTITLALGGPRLIESLPCTLQPNAIFAAAPPVSRRLSLLSAGLVYAALAFTLGLAARERVRAAVPAGPTQRLVFSDWVPPVIRALPPPVKVAGNGMRPADAPVSERPVASDQVPDLTPTALSTLDRSHAGQFTADMPVSKEGTGRLLETRPAEAPQTQATQAPVQLELQNMRVLSQVQPVYPALARVAHLQGPVVLLMTVDARGVPAEVQVLSGPHPSLNNEALRVARLWRFEPARVDGQAVPAQFHLTVVFRLAS